MKIEPKVNYDRTHRGSFWAEEADAIVNEIVNTFKAFFSPRKTSESQMASGIVLTSMSNFWYAGIHDNQATLYRRDGLPIPDYYDGLVGHFKMQVPNPEPNTTFRFLGKLPIPLVYRGKFVEVNQLLVGEIFFFHIELTDNNEIVANVYPVTLAGKVEISEGSGRMITSEPILIQNNRFTVDTPINGDLVFNRVECYLKVNGQLTTEYDTKRGEVNEFNRKEVIIHDDGDSTSVNGRYAIISYTI
jgi:hypothetical protein